MNLHNAITFATVNTSASWTTSNWGTSGAGPFTTAWTSGNDAFFTADSTITFATTAVGNVTLSDNVEVNVTTGGTLTLGGVRTFDIGEDSTLNWASQSQSSAVGNEGAGIIKDGAGTLNWGSGGGSNDRYNGGFTLNEGRVIVSGNNSFGIGVLTINGGTIQSSGSRTFAASSVVIGGDFEIAGTGGWTMGMGVDLGAATRTITTSSTGTKTWNGVVSGGVGAGLTFENPLATSTVHVFTNAANSFSGPIEINGGEVEFTAAGALGSGTSITIDGGRLALRGDFELASTKNVFLGAGAEFSTPGGSTVITYNGVVADKVGDTGDFVKQGSGVLAIGGASTYTGSTSLNNGTVRLTTDNNRLPTGTVLNLGQAASTNLGTLDLNGFDQEVAGLNSTSGSNADNLLNNTVTSATEATLTIGGSGTYSYGDGSNANSGIITGANLAVVKNGSGSQTFGDTNTYGGGTTVNAGTLVIANNSGLGSASGDATLAGTSQAILRFTASTTVDNNVVYSNSNGASRVEAVVGVGSDFRTGTNGTFTSQLGGVDTGVQFLAGSSTAGTTMEMSFATLSPAVNDFIRLSDVFSLSGTATDVFVMQLNITGLAATDHLGWLNSSNEWRRAINGNIGQGTLGGVFYASSFADFVTNNGGTFDAATMLGAYGNDGSGGVWAVLNHNSDFAAVPEPSTWVLVGIGAMALIVRRKLARKA